MSRRRNHDAAFKARVALEAVTHSLSRISLPKPGPVPLD